MAAKTSWHRYGTKLRHCHPMYYTSITISLITCSRQVMWENDVFIASGCQDIELNKRLRVAAACPQFAQGWRPERNKYTP